MVLPQFYPQPNVGSVFPVGSPAASLWISGHLCRAWCEDIGLWSAGWRIPDRLMAGGRETLKGGEQECYY